MVHKTRDPEKVLRGLVSKVQPEPHREEVEEDSCEVLDEPEAVFIDRSRQVQIPPEER